MDIKNETELIDETEDTLQEDLLQEDNLDEETPEAKITRWKEAYPNGIFMSVYDDMDFIWHKIGRRDYTGIMESFKDDIEMTQEQAIMNRQKALISTCLLYPEEPNYDELFENLPGLVVSLSSEILAKSGFSKPLTVKL